MHVCRQTPTCEYRRGQIPCQWSYWCCELSDTGAGNWGWVLNKASTLLIASPLQPPSMPSNNTNIQAICTHTPPATKAHWARLLSLSWLVFIPFLFHPSHLSPYDKVEAASKFPKLGITTQIYLMYFHSYYEVLLFVVQKDWCLLTLDIHLWTLVSFLECKLDYVTFVLRNLQWLLTKLLTHKILLGQTKGSFLLAPELVPRTLMLPTSQAHLSSLWKAMAVVCQPLFPLSVRNSEGRLCCIRA